MTHISMTITRGAPVPAKRYVGWRGLHYAEGGREPTDLLKHPPAVIPAHDDKPVPMTDAIQRMSYELQLRFCDAVTRERWREPLHHHAFAMTNKGAGYGYPGGIPLRDYINNRDLTAMDGTKPALPKYDKCRTYQGSFITGRLEGNFIHCLPGIDGIDANKPLPTIDEIIERVWYSVSVATGNPPFHIRQQWGAGCVIVFPFIMLTETIFEAAHFTRWEDTSLPDPVRIYT